MGDLSDNFSRSEFQCKCGCGQSTVDYRLVILLEGIREIVGKPIKITSGNRCIVYNHSVGGKPKSQHLLGRAADIVVSGVDPEEVGKVADKLGAGGLGVYSTFTHVDSREGKARW